MAARTFPSVPAAATTRRGVFPAALTVAGATLVVVAFFLPWIHGAGVFALRTFSGFTVAGVLHSVTTGIDTSTAASLTPMLFYAAPAAAIGVALYTFLVGATRASAAASLAAGLYTLALVAAVLVVALTPATGAARLLGTPSYGLGLAAIGALLMLAASVFSRREGV